MKNYYEVLEVDKNASDDVIKVAYKSLVKKYHPDLKEGQEKVISEEKIKLINEAYDVLSDPIKREEYDITLMSDIVSAEEYNLIVNENINLKKQLNYVQEKYNEIFTQYQNTYNYHKSSNEENSKYNNYNNQYEHNNNYSSQYKDNNYYKTYKKSIFDKMDNTLKNLIGVILTFFVIYLLIKIPFINNFISNLLSDYLGNNMLFLFIIIFLFIYFFRNKK